jgi:hypothetical protein
MHVVIATHGHCFDGLCSSVLFTRLLRHLHGDAVQASYVSCGYGIGQRAASEQVLLGEQNAILDYRFFPSDRVNWYFDHHRTAFASDEDRAYFEQHRADRGYFFDASYGSCTQLLADICRDRYGLVDQSLAELVRWAHLVDSASFDSAQGACDASSPILRFVSVVEHHAGDAFLARTVPELLQKPLLQVASSPEVERLYAPLGKRAARFRKAVQSRAERRGRVVVVDLTDQTLDVLGKFVTYALFPDCVFSVVAARQKRGLKIAVGYNPWCGAPLDRDVSAICARYGGGGHQAVGGISFRTEQEDDARRAVVEIARELDSVAPS